MVILGRRGTTRLTTGAEQENRKSRIEAYLQRLYGYAYGLAGNRDDATDLVQECALKALVAKSEPEDEKAYRAWLFRILKNAFIDGLRKKANQPTSEDDEFIDQAVEYFDVEERLINAVTVRLALANLPDNHYRIISMVDIAGLSYAETAEELSLPLGTVMSRISRARKALIELIDSENVRSLPVRSAKRRI